MECYGMKTLTEHFNPLNLSIGEFRLQSHLLSLTGEFHSFPPTQNGKCLALNHFGKLNFNKKCLVPTISYKQSRTDNLVHKGDEPHLVAQRSPPATVYKAAQFPSDFMKRLGAMPGGWLE
ncbi:hypothetical protein OUZ56_033945 [Daphnia magna]|uniref:Uncharacterized protein n=1 Tax=Daphnia magna TaxID=35525 RepID=A0ABR0BBB3_9CRUS|nr:hypothetical protein OUZ56_033945 [Daphnia magna]